MCGFAGLLTASALPAESLRQHAARMAATLVHRGPDDAGDWADAAGHAAFGFRRLSILDLSAAGHQPMMSRSGRYAMVFNGEIYNFRELRARLDGEGAQSWRGHSDSEVILEAIERWGWDATLAALNGMFAIALWDARDRMLRLARDRLGEKPLYYGWTQAGEFVFGSELKALLAHPALARDIDRDALALYLHHACVPAPWSILSGVRKLPPGTALTLAADKATMRDAPRIEAFWSVKERAEAGARMPFVGNATDAEDVLDRLIRESVRLRLEADVPIGAFLSGGIDSSTVVAAMQAEAPGRVRSFAIGFRDPRFDEAPFAAAIARHLGTDHTELYVDEAQALALLPRLPDIYDEPFADVSQIPTALLAELTRRHVTVGLSGDGGDELFGGYPRYRAAAARWGKLAGRSAMSRATASTISGWLPADPPHALARIARRLEESAAPDAAAYYRLYMSRWRAVRELAPGAKLPAAWGANAADLPASAARFMQIDAAGYLPDDLLVKVDRATMAYGLEARAPLLDHRIAEFAWSLPLDLKIRGETGKWLLRNVLARYVPRDLWERPKQGFEPPIGQWLRESLRDWAEHLLDERRLREDGLIAPEPVRRRWQEHLSGKRDWRFELWSVLMFQAWKERWLSA